MEKYNLFQKKNRNFIDFHLLAVLIDNVFFLSNYLKLKDALLNFKNEDKFNDKKKTNFFNYNPNYDLWNNLINKEN